MNWFEVKIRYDKQFENGLIKKTTDLYLVDSCSFTEAEARIIEEIKPYISGKFSIADIKRAKLSEIFFNKDGDRFYKAKVEFITLDEKSGNEKKTPCTMLIQASTLEEALQGLQNGMSSTLADYNSALIAETKIVDIFPYSKCEN